MNKSLAALYTSNSIAGLAWSIIGIFVPAYLISLGYALPQVFGYFLQFSIWICVAFYLSALIARKTGVRAVMIGSYPFLFTYLALLYALHGNASTPLPFIALIQGVQVGMAALSLHIFFTTNAKSEEMGKDIGRLLGLPQIAGLIGPLIGAAVVIRVGFPALFVVGAVIFLVSLVPIFWIPDRTVVADFGLRSMLREFKSYKRYSIIQIFENAREELEGTILPLFIFITFKDAFSVGLIGTLTALGVMFLTLLLGKTSDSVNPKIFLRIGAVGMTLVWLIRYLVPQLPVAFYILSLVAGVLIVFIDIPFTRYIYGTAKQGNLPEFLVYREFPVMIGRAAIYAAAILIANTKTLFIAGAVTSAILLLF